MTQILFDAAPIGESRKTADGYYVATARAARVGLQNYMGAEINRPDLGIVRVLRPEATVFDRDSLSTYAHKPITVNHPAAAVSSENWRDHAVDHVGGDVIRDGDFVRISLMLADAAAIRALEAGTRELSVGYACDLRFDGGVTGAGEAFDAVQHTIRVNHVALVERGRAGPQCRIGDSLHQGKDSTMISIHDAIAQIPSEYQSKIRYAESFMNGDSRTEIESGIRNMSSVRYSLSMAADGNSAGPMGMVTDSDRTLCKRVVEYIDGKIAAAQERAHRL